MERSPEDATVALPSTLVEPALLPLEPGDHLTRAEFERRYDAMPHLKKAELIEGIVYMPPMVRFEQHGEPHGSILLWLGTYAAHTPGVRFGDNFSIRLAGDNMPQPDAAMMIDPSRGGRVMIADDGCIEGAPELVVEVAASTASLDLNAKLRVYLRDGVREYIVWRTIDRAIDWFILRDGRYDRLPLGADGLHRSEVFPGLWLDPAALVASNLARLLDVVRLGVASPQHAAFVDRLGKTEG